MLNTSRFGFVGSIILLCTLGVGSLETSPLLFGEDQQVDTIPWEIRMKGLVNYLRNELAYLREHTHSDIYLKRIKELEQATQELSDEVEAYMLSSVSDQTQDKRKTLANKYCTIINEVVLLREKINPPLRGGAKEV